MVEIDVLQEQISSLLSEKQFSRVRETVAELIAADAALLFEGIPEKEIPLLFRLLPKELAAETFAYMESDRQRQLIEAFSDRELREVMDQIFLDDTVDLIEEMPANVVSRILANTDALTRKQINDILQYPEDSAGSLMTVEYVALRQDMTVTEAFAHIRLVGVDKETIYTCYVTENRRLLGTVSVKDLLIAEEDTRVGKVMETNVVFVDAYEDKEVVAELFGKYDIAALPVVDRERRLVGIVTFDDAMDVMQEETTEDIQKMAAITSTDTPYMKIGAFELFWKRIPWLLLLMISSVFTQQIINSFEKALAVQTALIAFIPMLMGTGGNAGSQASVTIIRSLSLHEVELRNVFSVIWKELRVALLCGAALAAANFAKLMLLDQVGLIVSLTVCLTLIVTVIVAKLVGCSLPILAKRLGFDPAVMASPFITTIIDALSLLMYFQIASWLLPS